MFKIKVGAKAKDEIVINANMPGAVDFDKGIVKVDYQLWPFFQAIDLDHILVCIEVSKVSGPSVSALTIGRNVTDWSGHLHLQAYSHAQHRR